jgi:hypothetical protein
MSFIHSSGRETMKARVRRIMLSASGLCLAAIAVVSTASAQLAVSSNDTKLVSVDSVNGIVENRAADDVTIVDLCVSPSIVPKPARSSLRLRLRNSLSNPGRHESPLHYTSYRTRVPGSDLHGGIHAVD